LFVCFFFFLFFFFSIMCLNIDWEQHIFLNASTFGHFAKLNQCTNFMGPMLGSDRKEVD
jgi:hypothetical protein